MNNLERLQMAIEGIDLTTDKLTVYLEENNLTSTDLYNPQSNSNKKLIYSTALSILEDIANNPQLMKNYKTEDVTISQFSENLQTRISVLENKIRTMQDDNDISDGGASFIYMFSEE